MRMWKIYPVIRCAACAKIWMGDPVSVKRAYATKEEALADPSVPKIGDSASHDGVMCIGGSGAVVMGYSVTSWGVDADEVSIFEGNPVYKCEFCGKTITSDTVITVDAENVEKAAALILSYAGQVSHSCGWGRLYGKLNPVAVRFLSTLEKERRNGLG